MKLILKNSKKNVKSLRLGQWEAGQLHPPRLLFCGTRAHNPAGCGGKWVIVVRPQGPAAVIACPSTPVALTLKWDHCVRQSLTLLSLSVCPLVCGGYSKTVFIFTYWKYPAYLMVCSTAVYMLRQPNDKVSLDVQVIICWKLIQWLLSSTDIITKITWKCVLHMRSVYSVLLFYYV